LIVRLSDDKLEAWSKELRSVIFAQRIRNSHARSLIGKLEHAQTWIPLCHYFLNHIRRLFAETAPPFAWRPIGAQALTDLEFWLSLLKRAHEGVSMNIIIDRKPTNIILTNACPQGIGGYSPTSGRGWYHAFSPDITSSGVSNNFFEFLGIAIGVIVEIEEEQSVLPDSSLLALGDNTSSVGWLHRSNFSDSTQGGHDAIARRLVSAVLDAKSTLFGQHIAGSKHVVADFLSRPEKHREFENCKQITSHILYTYRNQVPENFHASPLQSATISVISSMTALAMRSCTQKSKPLMRKSTSFNAAGLNSSSESHGLTTPSLTTPRTLNATSLSVPSYSRYEGPPIQKVARSLLAQALSQKPLATWHRSSGVTIGRAPATCRKTRSNDSQDLPPS